mmetsp:Transcript_13342/g.22947  ORF Transcript_13342/g.22947 Transcript_13342/m.22947 type:complete len:111 (+) Transcript_13342:47-379(+)
MSDVDIWSIFLVVLVGNVLEKLAFRFLAKLTKSAALESLEADIKLTRRRIEKLNTMETFVQMSKTQRELQRKEKLFNKMAAEHASSKIHIVYQIIRCSIKLLAPALVLQV